jgi:class 3 adenylate cyclase
MAEWPEQVQPQPSPQVPVEAEAKLQRVADADRDRTIVQLREHVVDGRLTLDEFSERVGAALEARTTGDLEAVMVNLPALGQSTSVEVSPRKSRRWHVAVMSGSDTKGRWRIGTKTNAVAVMGGCNLDLRTAEIESPEVVITAFAFWGGIQVTVPEGFDVALEGFSFMGGRSIKLRDVPLVPGSPRIRIRGFSIMAGIDVRSKPARGSNKNVLRSVLDGVQGVVDLLPEPGSTEPIDLASLGAYIRRELRDARGEARSAVRDSLAQARADAGAAPAMRQRPDRDRDRDRDRRDRRPGPPPGPSDGTVTILFSDMVDYAGMTERLGDHDSREILRQHHRIVRSQVERHGGREVSVQGDGFMVAFGGVARALRCAIDVQRAFRSYSEENVDRPISVHIGVHTGDAVEEDDDFLGHTVIVASRLAATAAPGEILVSSLSEQLVQGSGEFTFFDYREATLKGLTRAQPAAALAWTD